jgi:hypothetical protein
MWQVKTMYVITDPKVSYVDFVADLADARVDTPTLKLVLVTRHQASDGFRICG